MLVTMRLERAPLSVAETVLLLVEMKDGKMGQGLTKERFASQRPTPPRHLREFTIVVFCACSANITT